MASEGSNLRSPSRKYSQNKQPVTASSLAAKDPKALAASLKKQLLQAKNMQANSADPDKTVGSSAATSSTTISGPSAFYDDDMNALILESFNKPVKPFEPTAPTSKTNHDSPFGKSPIQNIPGLGSATQTQASKTALVEGLQMYTATLDPFAQNPAQSIGSQAGLTLSGTSKHNDGGTTMTTPSKAVRQAPGNPSASLTGTQQASTSHSDTNSQGQARLERSHADVNRHYEAPRGPATTSVARPQDKTQQAIRKTSPVQGARTSKPTDTETVDAIVAKTIEQCPELHEWLTLTGWFNVEKRNNMLALDRKAKDVEAARKRLDQEQEAFAEQQRQMLESGGIEQNFFPSITRARPCPQPLAPATPSTRGYSVDESHGSTINDQVNDFATPQATLKRGREDGNTPEQEQEKRAKTQKLGTYQLMEPKATTKGGDNRPSTGWDRGQDNERGDLSRRRSPSFPRCDTSRRRSPSRKHNGRDASHNNSFSDPKPIDLGGEGDTRFFILKSYSTDNVRMCMKEGFWTTQAHNTETLTNAYRSCKNVILFFSVNDSKCFQGYARMLNAPSDDTPLPSFSRYLRFDKSPPFRVEWLSKTEIYFSQVSHIRNPLRNDKVSVGKDGQEIEDGAGRKLLRAMEQNARSKNGTGGPRDWDRDREADLFGPSWAPRSHGGGSSNRGGGYNNHGHGGRYVKDEDY